MRAFTNSQRFYINITTVLNILLSFSACSQAATPSCRSPFHNTDCPNGMTCEYDGASSFVCVQKFYNSCEISSDCSSGYPYRYGECVFLIPNESLSRWSDKTSTGKERCFCAPTIPYCPITECEVNTAEIDTSFDDYKYCLPCSWLSAPNQTSAHNAFLTRYSYQNPPLGLNGSFFHC